MLPRKSLLKRRRIGGASAENIVCIVLTDSNLSCIFQADSVSKLLQPAYQAVLYSLRVAPIKVIGSQFCKGCAPIHHVIADSKDGMSYSQRRSPASLACRNAPKLRSQIGLLTASGGPPGFGQSAFEMLIAETTACGVTSPSRLLTCPLCVLCVLCGYSFVAFVNEHNRHTFDPPARTRPPEISTDRPLLRRKV